MVVTLASNPYKKNEAALGFASARGIDVQRTGVPPRSLLTADGCLWQPRTELFAVFWCFTCGTELERAEVYWCCPKCRSKLIHDTDLQARLQTGLRRLRLKTPTAEGVLRRMKRRSKWLWGAKGREQWKPL